MARRMLTILFLTLVLVSLISGQCPSGWSFYKGSIKCFYISTTANTYAEQSQSCQSLGGTLAVIKSAEENKFVSDYAASVLGASTTVTKYAFIGLSNPNGVWQWVDSTAPSYTNWQPNQPDGTGASAASITPVVKQTALDSWGWKVGGWDDNSQTSNQYAVCQKDAVMCPSGWSYYAGTNKCFYVNSGTNTYSAQLQNCQSLGGTLAVIKSAEENKFVSDYAASVLGASTTVTKYAFIGLSNSNSAWKWVDSTAPSYTNWQPNQPDGTGANAASITPVVKQTALDSWGWKVGGWDDNSQTSNQYAVCQMNANGGGDSGTCSTPYTHINMSLAGSNFWDEAQLTYVTKTPGADGNFVYYVSKSEGESLGLISVVNGQARMAAESKTVLSADSTGRKSIRVNTKYLYNGGLLVLDFEHMPVGKGTWPAFWTTGWVGSKPVNGEIDILEEGAGQTKNRISLHTTPECTLPKEDQGSMYTGAIYGGYATNCSSPGGCSIQESAGSFGPQVNNDKGGVLATEWIKDKYISVWHFKRSEIPADLIAGKPCPSSWGKPVAYFRLGANCPPEHFNSMRITINTSFCGPMARVYFDGITAAEKQSNCEEYVRNNPNAFVDAYWLINSIKVYTK